MPSNSQTSCPVHGTFLELARRLESGVLRHPRTRRIVEELCTLVGDIAAGRAGNQHLSAIYERVSDLLAHATEPEGAATAKWMAAQLADHRETFCSHVETQNCAVGQCDYLTPAPCQMACPAGIDVPAYVALIGAGKDAEAIEVIRRDNPFPWVCGLVCTRPCELMCVRARIDAPVAIKPLKAFAAERALSWGQYQNPAPAPSNGRKVGVIGAGPAGLSAAFYLAMAGYGVRVIEALPSAGGMMLVGIPRFRLPREVIDREVAMLRSLGVEFQFGTRFGHDVRLEQLKQAGCEAFFLAIGAHACFRLGIAGEHDYPQVHGAIDFLQRVAQGERTTPGRRVVVIGGGNVAIDAARNCLRLGCESVILAYRRTRAEMPADVEEVEQAEEEGVQLNFLTIPVSIEGQDDHVTALRCIRARMVTTPGSQRPSPKPLEGSEFSLAVDAVISAIGQRVELHWLRELKDLGWTRRDTLRVHTATMETDIPGIFAAGDAVTGPATVVEAIGGGKRAAAAIDRYLRQLPQPNMPPVPVRRRREACMDVPAATKMLLKRPVMPLLAIDRRRTTFQQVELGYAENMVREEASRCLRCDICRRCGRCVEICRDKMGVDALQLGYLQFDHPGATDFRFTQERCIACGACAANCPTGAMRMQDHNGERVLSLCGTILNRQPLVSCAACGTVIGVQRYLDFIRRRVEPKAPAAAGQQALCDACARSKGVRENREILPLI